jgi:lipopolysaccharide/colanic/teichoic acid biosynthesis glycosyltransferase
MTLSKRIFDILVALLLGVLLLPLVLVVWALILVRDGRPVFYISERMKTAEQGFPLVKFRTMSVVEQDQGVSGGDKAARITKTGAFLRKYRLDEVPQLWNVLRGDISFVGPRPPLRRYVEAFPEIYNLVLTSRPGITGLATVIYHQHEEHLLASCQTAEETEQVYVSRCIPVKARLDLIYQENQSVCFDVKLMMKTVFKRISL